MDDTALTWAQRAAWYEVEDQPDAEELRFWAAACDGAPSILIVPGGAGSLACALTAPERRTVAVDLEEPMVRRACTRLGACPGDNIAIVGDMRSVSLGEAFARVCVPRAALQLLPPDEQRRALTALAGHLDARGLLIVDLVRLGHARVQRTAFYDPSIADGTRALDWVRRLPDGGYLARWRTQHHDGSGVKLRFEYALAPSRSSATAAAPSAHAVVALHAFDDAALTAVAYSLHLAVGWDPAPRTHGPSHARSCRHRVALSRCAQPDKARSSSSRKCATPSSRPATSGPGSK